MVLRWILSCMVIIKFDGNAVCSEYMGQTAFLFGQFFKSFLKSVFLCLTITICSDRLSIWISTRI